MGFFSKFFPKSTLTETPVDLSVLKCDVHSHFIPGIDDGAKDMEDSINLLREFHNFGYKKVITTPHIMSDYYRNTPEIILSGLEKVRTALKNNGIPLEIEAAAEYYADYEFDQLIEKKSVLTFGKNHVLFELSFIQQPENLQGTIFKLQTNGYKPVLAHPERYNYWHNNFEIYEDLADKGVLLQLNINSLTGYYSPETKRIAQMMIDRGIISLLGSDCHHTGHINLMKDVVYEQKLHALIQSGKLLNHAL